MNEGGTAIPGAIRDGSDFPIANGIRPGFQHEVKTHLKCHYADINRSGTVDPDKIARGLTV